MLGLPKPLLIISGPIIAGTIVAIIFKLANLDRWHGPAESILAAHVTSKRPNTEAGLLSTLASAVSLAGGASVGQYGPLVHFGGVLGDYFSKLLKGGKVMKHGNKSSVAKKKTKRRTKEEILIAREADKLSLIHI